LCPLQNQRNLFFFNQPGIEKSNEQNGQLPAWVKNKLANPKGLCGFRSEERRVGKEWQYGWADEN